MRTKQKMSTRKLNYENDFFMERAIYERTQVGKEERFFETEFEPGSTLVWSTATGKSYRVSLIIDDHRKADAYGRVGGKAVAKVMCDCPEHQELLRRFADRIAGVMTELVEDECAELLKPTVLS